MVVRLLANIKSEIKWSYGWRRHGCVFVCRWRTSQDNTWLESCNTSTWTITGLSFSFLAIIMEKGQGAQETRLFGVSMKVSQKNSNSNTPPIRPDQTSDLVETDWTLNVLFHTYPQVYWSKFWLVSKELLLSFSGSVPTWFLCGSMNHLNHLALEIVDRQMRSIEKIAESTIT